MRASCALRRRMNACVQSPPRPWRIKSDARRMFDLLYAIDGAMLSLAIAHTDLHE